MPDSPVSLSDISSLIRNRRSVFPHMYNQEPISDADLMEILENANWAPTHKMTEPWRFIVFRGEELQKLGTWLADTYRRHTTEKGDYSEAKEQKFRERPIQSQCVLAICMQPDPDGRLPEWEELAAMSCAVQNIWLTCAAKGIGAYWSSPGFVINAPDFPYLRQSWQCCGLFYMGRWDGFDIPATRGPVSEKLIWPKAGDETS